MIYTSKIASNMKIHSTVDCEQYIMPVKACIWVYRAAVINRGFVSQEEWATGFVPEWCLSYQAPKSIFVLSAGYGEKYLLNLLACVGICLYLCLRECLWVWFKTLALCIFTPCYEFATYFIHYRMTWCVVFHIFSAVQRLDGRNSVGVVIVHCTNIYN